MAPKAQYKTINPANGQLIKSFTTTSDQEVHAALDKTHDVYISDWRHRTVKDRCRIMSKAAALMRERKKELTELGILEMGKTIGAMQAEVDLSANILEYYAIHGEEIPPDLSAPGSTRRCRRVRACRRSPCH
jgi:succinate-semialdehyde dehydrogenase/glutarate-semialdehyde dehydrogenase